MSYKFVLFSFKNRVITERSQVKPGVSKKVMKTRNKMINGLTIRHILRYPNNLECKIIPPRPVVRINNIDSGVVLFIYMDEMTDKHADVSKYEIYAAKEISATFTPQYYLHVGDVKAIMPPIAVTLKSFREKERYRFAVRAVDIHSRFSDFSRATKLTYINIEAKKEHPALTPAPILYPNNLPTNPEYYLKPPRPILRIKNIDSGIVLSINMDEMTDKHGEVAIYQIYSYHESSPTPSMETWRHVGDVTAMPLPMEVTLTTVQEGERYRFLVRAVDTQNQYGIFCIPKTCYISHRNHQMRFIK